MKHLISLAFLMILTAKVEAQEYITEGKNRLNFAKTYFEIGGQYSNSFLGKRVLSNGGLQSFKNSPAIAPYLNIGGIHFWGHADFYISIPLTQVPLKKSDSTNFTFNRSVVTGARYLPWAYQADKLRPYIGGSWAIVNFQNKIKPEENQPLLSKNKLMLDAGILYGKTNLIARMGINMTANNTFDYPISKTNFQQITTPSWNAYVGFVFAFESTRSKKMERINKELIKFPNISSPTLNAANIGDWFAGVGPSTSFIVGNSDYNKSVFPYFNKKLISNTFLDFSLGYQFNKLGIITAISYRSPRFKNQAFGTVQKIYKRSFVIESFKFLTDYSGFTPYVGLSLSINRIDYSEQFDLQNFKQEQQVISPGITFGWDILPGKTEQPFVLRTNLRWFPLEKISIKNKNFSLNQIEYDVIQLVYYPARSKRLKTKYKI